MPADNEDYLETTLSFSPEGDTTGGTTEETTQANDGEAGVAAPEAGAGEGEAAEGAKAGETATPNKGKAAESGETTTTEIKAEDVLARLSPTETPEAKVARLERDYSASSKEALRLKGDNEDLAEIFASQNIEVVRDAKGRPTGIAPTKEYGKGDPEVSVDFNSLSNEVQALAEDNPQKFIDAVLNEAKSSLVRVTPTVEKAVKPLSPERVEQAESYLKGMLEPDGTPTHPDFEKNLNVVRQYVNDPSKPQSFKDFVAQSPEMAYEYAQLKISATIAIMQREKQKTQEALAKKEQESADTAHPGPAGGGSPDISRSVDIAKIGSDLGDRIAAVSSY